MGNEVTNRRGFLGGVATAAAIGLSGCTSSEAGDGSASGELSMPRVDERRLDSGGWERIDRMADEREVADLVVSSVTASTRTDVYEKAALRERVREDTLGNFDAPLATFFASRTELDPGVDSIPGSSGMIVERAREQAHAMIVDQMGRQGLSDVTRSGETTLEVETGEEADLHRYSARFEYDSMTFPIAEGEQLQIPGGALDIAGEYAIWHDGEYLLVAGGVIPAENFEESVEREITDAISVTVSVNLGLEPERLLEELRTLEKSVK